MSTIVDMRAPPAASGLQVGPWLRSLVFWTALKLGYTTRTSRSPGRARAGSRHRPQVGPWSTRVTRTGVGVCSTSWVFSHCSILIGATVGIDTNHT